MPNKNGMGPQGQGPNSGRGNDRCNRAPRGTSFNLRNGRQRGQRFGQQPGNAKPTDDNEQLLRQQLVQMQQQLDTINQVLNDLSKQH